MELMETFKREPESGETGADVTDMRNTETRTTAMKRVSMVSVSCVHKKWVGILVRGGYGGTGK